MRIAIDRQAISRGHHCTRARAYGHCVARDQARTGTRAAGFDIARHYATSPLRRIDTPGRLRATFGGSYNNRANRYTQSFAAITIRSYYNQRHCHGAIRLQDVSRPGRHGKFRFGRSQQYDLPLSICSPTLINLSDNGQYDHTTINISPQAISILVTPSMPVRNLSRHNQATDTITPLSQPITGSINNSQSIHSSSIGHIITGTGAQRVHISATHRLPTCVCGNDSHQQRRRTRRSLSFGQHAVIAIRSSRIICVGRRIQSAPSGRQAGRAAGHSPPRYRLPLRSLLFYPRYRYNSAFSRSICHHGLSPITAYRSAAHYCTRYGRAGVIAISLSTVSGCAAQAGYRIDTLRRSRQALQSASHFLLSPSSYNQQHNATAINSSRSQRNNRSPAIQ